MAIPTEQRTIQFDEYFDDFNMVSTAGSAPEAWLNGNTEPSMLSESRVTVVDVFPSVIEAQTAVSDMEDLDSYQISIIGKDYCQESEDSINWENIMAAGGLAEVLSGLGISGHATVQFMEAIENGKFLLIAVNDDHEVAPTNNISESISTNIKALLRVITVHQYALS